MSSHHPLVRTVAALVVLFAASLPARAQMVSATTGAIKGQVTDDSNAPLAGVSVTILSPALQGFRTAITNARGFYRFPAISPGTYKVAFQKEGYSTAIFEAVRISLGFTATVDLRLKARASETQVVSDRGPVIDRTSTRTSTEFDAAKLASAPSARNMWAILEQTPAMRMSTVDVGGSRAGSQSGYTTYDAKGGQARVTLDGLVTTEGTGSIGVYFDYGAIAESSTGTASQGAEMGWPGVQSMYIAKSGGADYHGSFYYDYENESIQMRNVSQAQIDRGATSGPNLPARDANRLHAWNVLNADVGGYLPRLREKGWWYAGFRRNVIETRLVNYPVAPQKTALWNYSGKGTFQLSPNNRAIAYAQRVLKVQPNRLASASSGFSPVYTDAASTTQQRHWSWVYKAEYDRVLNDSMFFEVRGGQFGYDWPLRPNDSPMNSTPRIEDLTTGAVSGASRDWLQSRRRNQAIWSLTIFGDNWTRGTHNVKVGGDFFFETYEEQYLKGWGNNDSVSQLRAGRPAAVVLFETPSDSLANLNTTSLYAADTWQVGRRLTVSPSVRWDHYRGFLPAQDHAAGLWNRTPQSFPKVDPVINWSLIAPRVGATYDVGGDGKTILKAFWGRYYWNPGTDFMFNLHPNSVSWTRTYQWTNDANGNGRWDPGEEGALTATQGGKATEFFDSNVKDTYTNEVTAWLEREVLPNFSLRGGFVYRGIRSTYSRMNVNWPMSAFNVPVTVSDPGPDGVAGNGDDGPAIALHNLDPSLLKVTPVYWTRNVPDRFDYYNVEVTGNRRFSKGWSLLATWAKRWNRDNGQTTSWRQNAYVLNPNDLVQTSGDGRFHYTYSTWKIQATYDAPWGLRVSPTVNSVSGQQWGRTIRASMNYSSTVTVLTEPVTSRRQDSLTFVSVRLEKRLRPALARKATVGILVDFYNLLNNNPVEAMNWASGSAFMRPTTIPGPMIVRFGAKVDW